MSHSEQTYEDWINIGTGLKIVLIAAVVVIAVIAIPAYLKSIPLSQFEIFGNAECTVPLSDLNFEVVGNNIFAKDFWIRNNYGASNFQITITTEKQIKILDISPSDFFSIPEKGVQFVSITVQGLSENVQSTVKLSVEKV